jgi:hypothetical protein
MRPITFAALLALIPAVVWAQTPTHSANVKTRAVAKGNKKAPVADPGEPAEIDADRLAMAPLVLQGESTCDVGQKVSVKEHPTLPGRFQLKLQGKEHVLTPLPTTTGVVRLENKRTGLVWLQVPVKSMLMDSKKGQRLADGCMHPSQMAEIEAMRSLQPN